MSVASAVRNAFPAVKQEFVPFDGGLDTVTPPLRIPPGFVRFAQNYEVDINGGYGTVVGHERRDGRPRPSGALYAIINITLTGSIAVGNTVTGATSGATAVVIAVTSSYIAVTKIVGTFQSAENLNVSGFPQATTTSGTVIDGAASKLLHAQYRNLAADVYRADITAVPGSGGVLGVWLYNDVVYAVRNNSGGTAAVLHKSSAGGWVAVGLEFEIGFSNANTSVEDGDTLTQGVVTATIRRVVVQTGTLASGVNTGRLIIAAPSGGNFGAGAATSTGGGALTLSGIQTAITLQPNGRYEVVLNNFGGAANTKRVYGCDRVNRGFEFDGSVFVPIVTGMSPDAPTHVSTNKNHLFFSFAGSVQHSGIGAPYAWSVILGAAELAIGDTVTGFQQQPGSETSAALAIFSRNKTTVLYGSSAADWNLITVRDDTGAYEYTIQQPFDTMMLDDRGVITLATTQAFGNFDTAAVTRLIKSWLNDRRTNATASMVAKEKDQYRLFFSDGYGLFITTAGRKVVGIMPVLYPNAVKCAFSGEDSSGNEVMLFGSSNGFVYEMERGTSFDGEPIEAFMYLVWNSSQSPRISKSYKTCMLEISGSGYAEFQFSYELGYNSTLIHQPGSETVVTSFSPSFWDTGFWDAGVWDGQTLSPSVMKMDGTAENVSLIIRSNSDYFSPLRFSGAMIDYIPRRRLH